jgi:hypothetical protein
LDPTIRPNHRSDDLASTFQADFTARIFEICFVDQEKQITAAECGPVKAISLIEEDFILLSRPRWWFA